MLKISIHENYTVYGNEGFLMSKEPNWKMQAEKLMLKVEELESQLADRARIIARQAITIGHYQEKLRQIRDEFHLDRERRAD